MRRHIVTPAESERPRAEHRTGRGTYVHHQGARRALQQLEWQAEWHLC